MIAMDYRGLRSYIFNINSFLLHDILVFNLYLVSYDSHEWIAALAIGDF